jgi:hypothetical protein
MTDDPSVLPEANEADEAEQAIEARPESDEAPPPARPWDADEADLMDQSRPVPSSDEDESPDEE